MATIYIDRLDGSDTIEDGNTPPNSIPNPGTSYALESISRLLDVLQDDDEIRATGDVDLSGSTLSVNGLVYYQEDGNSSTLTLGEDQVSHFDQITGTGDFHLSLTGESLDISGIDLRENHTAVHSIDLIDEATAQTVTLSSWQIPYVSQITGTAAVDGDGNFDVTDDTIVIVNPDDIDFDPEVPEVIDIRTVSLVEIEEIVLQGEGAKTLVVGETQITGMEIDSEEYDGSEWIYDDTIEAFGGLDLRGSEVDDIDSVKFGTRTTGATLTISGEDGDEDNLDPTILGSNTIDGTDKGKIALANGWYDLSGSRLLNVTSVAMSAEEELQAIGLTGEQASGMASISGVAREGEGEDADENDDALVIVYGNANLSDVTLTNIGAIFLGDVDLDDYEFDPYDDAYDGGAQSLIMRGAQVEGISLISGEDDDDGYNDVLRFSSGDADLSKTSLDKLANVSLIQSNAKQTLTLSEYSEGEDENEYDVDAFTGFKTAGKKDDVLEISGGDLNLSDISVTNFAKLLMSAEDDGDTDNGEQDITLSATDAEGFDTIEGTKNGDGENDDELEIVGGDVDLSDQTLVTLGGIDLDDEGEVQTLTLTGEQAEGLNWIYGNQSDNGSEWVNDDILEITGDSVVSGSGDADLSGTYLWGLAQITLIQEDANQTLTLSGDQAESLDSITGSANSTDSNLGDYLEIAYGNADLSDVSVTGFRKLSLIEEDAAQTVTLTASDVEGMATIEGAGADSLSGDTLAIVGLGAIDLSDQILSNLYALTLADTVSGGTQQTLTLTGNQAGALAKITGTQDSSANDDVLVIGTGDADLSETELSNLAKIKLAGTGEDQTLTLSGEDAAALDTIEGTLNGSVGDDLVISEGNADLSGVTLTDLGTLTLADATAAQTLTLTGDQAEGFSAIVGTPNGSTDNDILKISSGDADLSDVTLTDLHTLSLTGSGAQSITLSGTQAEALKAITGTKSAGANDDILIIDSGDADLTGVDLTNIKEIWLTEVGEAQTLTLTKAQAQALSVIKGTDTGGVDDDHLIVSDDVANLTNVTLTDMAPTIETSSPADGATQVASGANIVLTMTEAVSRGTGNIVIHRKSDGLIIQTLDVSDTTIVTISGDQVTIDPPSNLASGAYYITIDGGAFLGVDNSASTSSAIGANIYNFTVHIPSSGGEAPPPPTNAGPDTMTGGDANDTIDAGNDNDLVNAGAGDDTVFGGLGDDTVTSGSGDDLVTAGAGTDLVYGNQGDDLIYGNQGDDTLFGGQENDEVFGGQNEDVAYGNFGDDFVYGNLGDDTLFGGQSADAVFGGQGNDQLFGNTGDDTLSGNLGDDTLTGGAGADVFTFGAQSGADSVTDFDFAAGDRLSVGGRSWSVDSNGDGDAVLSFTDGSSITLRGIQSGAVNSSWFVTA